MENIDQPQVLAERCAQHMYRDDKASQHLGITIQAVDEGSASVTMEVLPTMVNGHNTCHGGMLFSLADSCFAFACNSHNQAAVASACTIDFVAPAYLGDTLTASAKVQHQGFKSGVYDVVITNQLNATIAFFRGKSSRIKRPVLSED